MMRHIILFFCSIVLPVFSLKAMKPKLCINCKYFITDNDNGLFGKCSLFPEEHAKFGFLVNGVNEETYSFCFIARKWDDMCGEEGKLYKKKYTKKQL